MIRQSSPRPAGRRVARPLSAVLFVAGFVIAAAGAAFAFWTVTALSPSDSYALAQADSLSAPTTPTANVSGSSAIIVGWTLPVSQLAGAQFQVTRTTGPGSPTTVCAVASTVTSCQDTGLTGGTTYGYSVTAILSNWQSAAITTSATTQKASQTVTFTSAAPASATVGGAYTVAATASSGLAVTFSSPTTSVCTVSGSTVSFVGAGACTVNADQIGNANYNTAPQVQQSFAVAKGSQTITFTSTAPTSATVGGTNYTVTATSTSGLPVAFTLDAASTGCSLSGSTVSFPGAGTCKIDADQAGNVSYNAAAQVQQSFAVAKGPQTVTFTSTAPSSATVGGATYTVSATATSGLPVAFTLDAASTGCSLAGSTVSFTAVGTCRLDANQAGNANYTPAPQVQQSFAVAKGSQTITFTSSAPTGASVGGATYTVTATASSGLTVAFTSATTTVCTISGSTVSFPGAGTCTLNANQAGDINYNAAPQVQQSFTVGGTTLAITSVVRDGGGRKYDFTGVGASSSPAVSVTICDENVFPCTGAHLKATALTSTSSGVINANGTWKTGQDDNQLQDDVRYWAQAKQGSATSAAFSFVSTATTPAVTNNGVGLTNGVGTVRKADAGDKLTVTYGETLDAASFCSTWTNSGVQSSSASVQIVDNANNDTLANLTVSGCTFNFGSVALGANFVSATVTFGTSTVSWDPSTGTLTITLGGGTGQNTVGANAIPFYTASTSIKDRNGAAMTAGPWSGSSSSF